MRLSYKGKWLYLACLVAVSTLIFYPVLNAEFLQWDDATYVTSNALIHDFGLGRVLEIFATPQLNSSYNPVVLTHWMLDASLFGLNATVFHSVNLIWHCANAFLVFLLLQSWTQNTRLSLAVTAVFCTHPFNAEPVAWVTGRKDLMLGFFALATFLAYHKYVKSNLKTYRLLAIGFFTVALFSKGTAVVIPLILVLADICIYSKRSWTESVFRKWPYFIISLVFGFLAIYGQHTGGAFELEVSSLDKVVFGFNSFSLYVLKFFVPHDLSAYHPFPVYSWQSGFELLVIVVGVLIVAGLLIYSVVQRNRMAIFGLAFFTLWLLPVLQFKPFGLSFIGERFAYLAFLGLALTWVSLLMNWAKNVTMRRGLTGMFLVWTSVNAVNSNSYAKTWKNDASVWTNVQDTYPNDYMPYFQLSMIEVQKGNRDEAMRLLNRCIKLFPNFSDAFTNRGMLLMENGEYNEALVDFDRALELDSTNAIARLNRGVTLFSLKRYTEALESLQRTTAVENEIAELIHYNCGRVYEAQGNIDQARQRYKASYELNPTNPEFIFRYARSEGMLLNLITAEEVVLKGLKSYPKNTTLLILLSETQATKGEFGNALQSINQAQALGAKISEVYIQDLKNRMGLTEHE